jgi:hypothetical protein
MYGNPLRILSLTKGDPQFFYSKVEVIATKILRSSSQSGLPLRNIHISSDNGSFTFYVDVFFPPSLPINLSDLTLYMDNTAGVV